VLDYTNNYGVRPFWPFSEKWYSWDIVFIVDPIILILLVLDSVADSVLLYRSRDRSPRKDPPGRWGATIALLGVVALWGVRNYEHQRSVNALEARTYENADPLRASAYPLCGIRFAGSEWLKPGFLRTTMVDSITPEVDPGGEMQILYKPEETPVTLAAKRFLSWTRLSRLAKYSDYRKRAARIGRTRPT